MKVERRSLSERDQKITAELFGEIADAVRDADALRRLRGDIQQLREAIETLADHALRVADDAATMISRLDELEHTTGRLAPRPVMLEAPPSTSPMIAASMVPGEIAALAPYLRRIAIDSSAPRRGIYFLIRGARVVYVGQSTGILARISEHLRDKRFEGAVALPLADEDDLSALEGALIRWLRPELNLAGLGPVSERDRALLADLGLSPSASTVARADALEPDSGRPGPDTVPVVSST